ncbi:MAG: hypothetical protein U0Y68_08165 [Blastocatellia bacterium]
MISKDTSYAAAVMTTAARKEKKAMRARLGRRYGGRVGINMGYSL